MTKKARTSKESEGRDPKKKKSIQIELPVIPSDEKTMDEEMSDLFDEDRVKHKHGGTEPERD